MYAPGVLWTAARHKIPLLAVMHNNRGYHQESMHVLRFANFRDREVNERVHFLTQAELLKSACFENWTQMSACQPAALP